jgi:hypothetical protein
MDVWTNPFLLKDLSYLKSVRPGLYAMRCKDQNFFRIGVCGISSATTSAFARLNQVRGGMGKLGKWSFCFLAQLPDEVANKSRECEIFYQAAMFRKFDYIGISHIRANSEEAVQSEAREALVAMCRNPSLLTAIMPSLETMASQSFVDEWLAAQAG